MSGNQQAVARLTGALLAPKGEARPAEGGEPDERPTPARRGSRLLPYTALFLAGAAVPAVGITIWMLLKEPPSPIVSPTGTSLAAAPAERPSIAAARPSRSAPPAAATTPQPAPMSVASPAGAADAPGPMPSIGPFNPAATAAVGAAAALATDKGPVAAPVAAATPSRGDAPARVAASPTVVAAGSPPPPAPPPIAADDSPAAPPPAAREPAPAPTARQRNTESPPVQAAAPRAGVYPAPPKPRPSGLAERPTSGGGYYVQLSSVTRRALVDGEIKRLGRVLSRPLAGRSLVVHDGVARGGDRVFRIRVGPMADKGAARRLCARVKAGHADCLVVRLPEAS